MELLSGTQYFRQADVTTKYDVVDIFSRQEVGLCEERIAVQTALKERINIWLNNYYFGGLKSGSIVDANATAHPSCVDVRRCGHRRLENDLL